jgi:hypothetical protein
MPTTTIRYQDILNYLTAIATKANNPISASPHGDWWSGLNYTDFKTGQVPSVGGQIMDPTNPLQSTFYLALISTTVGDQMPDTVSATAPGPFITDTGYTATLADGTTISGTEIQQNIQSWLENGFPE